MYLLYSLLIIMLLAALSLLALPFLANQSSLKSLVSKSYLFSAIFIVAFSICLYQYSGNRFALKLWLTQGAQHYQLLEVFNQLGGVDGAIQRIEARLKSDPNDAQGWIILGKLYLSKQDTVKAKQAFTKAHELDPKNTEISNY